MVTDLTTDLTSHHIEGIAREGNVPFSVPLISHVIGNLWTGGCLNGVALPDDFAYVVSLYPWERYTIGPDTERFEFELYDTADVPHPEQLRLIAETINTLRRHGPTLAHCQAGLNRSALVAGLALVLDGMPPEEAIALLRSRRCDAVLCNATFETWLLRQGRGA